MADISKITIPSGTYNVKDPTVRNWVASRGENLVSNGTALLGDNTNFSTLKFDGSEAYYSPGSFAYNGNQYPNSDEFITIDTKKIYRLSVAVKLTTSVQFRTFLVPYDIDGLFIEQPHHTFIKGSTTKLAKDLNNGDTVVYLEDVSGFNTNDASYLYRRGLAFWGYKNSFGYEYPTETYTRYAWGGLWDSGASAIDVSNNTITLKKAWNKGSFKAGNLVSQPDNASGYMYGNIQTVQSGEWTTLSHDFKSSEFFNGLAKVKVGFWLQNGNITNISLTSNAGFDDLNTVLESKQNKLSSGNGITISGNNISVSRPNNWGGSLSSSNYMAAWENDGSQVRAMSWANAKTNLGLSNVENKSSATIRGELTKANVTTALGYTPPTKDTTYSVATTSANGLMSSTDKTKLDGVETGAKNNVIEAYGWSQGGAGLYLYADANATTQITGEAGKIYIVTAMTSDSISQARAKYYVGNQYRWDGSNFVKLTDSSKQDTLTAGTGINISGNTISATGTTFRRQLMTKAYSVNGNSSVELTFTPSTTNGFTRNISLYDCESASGTVIMHGYKITDTQIKVWMYNVGSSKVSATATVGVLQAQTDAVITM